MNNNLTWAGLRSVPVGTLVTFPQGWDIYPHCVVPVGTLAIVARNALKDQFPSIDLLPANSEVCRTLNEWHGCIVFTPENDGYEWGDESPVALHV